MLVTTRTAVLSDVPTLNQLIEQAVRQLSVGYYTPQQIDSSLEHVFGIDTQLIQDGTYYVAEADGQLAGCGGWSKRSTLYGGDQSKAVAGPAARSLARTRPDPRFFCSPTVGPTRCRARHHRGVRSRGAPGRVSAARIGSYFARRAVIPSARVRGQRALYPHPARRRAPAVNSNA
jgi:hypothetical protein